MTDNNPEDEILNRLSIDAALARLGPADRDMMLLITGYDRPVGYDGPPSPTLSDVGVYIGTKYRNKPLSEATMRNRRDAVLKAWKRAHDA